MKTKLTHLLLLMPLTTVATPKSHPNILFILVDDLGYGDVGFNGSKFFETPTIDSLAHQSVVFDNSYMYPTSSPSRTAIFTGQQSFRTGVYTVPVLEKGTANENIFSRWCVSTDIPIYSEILEQEGYSSIHLGKWHIVGPDPIAEEALSYPFAKKLGQPNPGSYSWVNDHKTNPQITKYYPEERGFIKNVGGTYRGDPALCEGGYANPNGGYRAPFTNPFIEQKEDDEWLTDRLTDEAMEFIGEHRNSPFFINLHYYTVHRPIVKRSEELYQKYQAKEGDPILGQGLGNKRDDHCAYATMIESLDDNVARLIKYLKDNDLYENTVIVFSSDNGHNSIVSSNNLMRAAKGSVYEGGVRVPTFIHWSGHTTPRTTPCPISAVDYFPTFLDIANIKYKGLLDGTSVVPLLHNDNNKSYNRPIIWQLSSCYIHGTCTAIRQGDYKLIQFLATGEVELYNLITDPKESKKIAHEYPKITQQLLDEITTWRNQNNVPLPPNSVVKVK
ncbi:MAG: sulfatase [Rikenellaceae bacterium]